MDVVIKERLLALVRELETTEVNQITELLKTNEGCCAEGIALEVRNWFTQDAEWEDEDYCYYYVDSKGIYSSDSAASWMDFYGGYCFKIHPSLLDNIDPDYKNVISHSGNNSLSCLNDSGLSFKQIAECIKYTYPELEKVND